MRILITSGLVLAGLMPATSALAMGQADVGNIRYLCPNACVTTNGPSGTIIVRDSEGGSIIMVPRPRPTPTNSAK